MGTSELVTYRLLVNVPLDLEWRGQRWRFDFSTPGAYCDGRCDISRTDAELRQFLFAHRETPARCQHEMTQIGIQMLSFIQAARLCEQLVKEGRAERLPCPRSWAEFPHRETQAA